MHKLLKPSKTYGSNEAFVDAYGQEDWIDNWLREQQMRNSFRQSFSASSSGGGRSSRVYGGRRASVGPIYVERVRRPANPRKGESSTTQYGAGVKINF